MVGGNPDVRCPLCATPCECLGAATPLPKKIDIKRWHALREAFYTRRRAQILALERERLRIVHAQEQRIKALDNTPKTKARDDEIERLTVSIDSDRNKTSMPRLSCDIGI